MFSSNRASGFATVTAMLCIVGCGSSPLVTAGDQSSGDDANVLGDLSLADNPQQDAVVVPDVVPVDAPPAELPPAEVNISCPGSAGCTCSANGDCDVGLCIETPTGKQCAAKCTDSCPKDYSCAAVSGSGGDILNVCVPSWGKLCNPCLTSAGCAAVGMTTPKVRCARRCGRILRRSMRQRCRLSYGFSLQRFEDRRRCKRQTMCAQR